MIKFESNGELVTKGGTNIHPSAVVSESARLGENVTIGPYCVIGDEVEIGDGSIIGPHAVIEKWTSLGRECRVYQFASVGAAPQDLKFKGERSFTIIGDRTTIREGATIHRATGEDNETRIGNDCLLMAYIHVAHNCTLGNHVIMSNLASCAGHATVEDRVVIGGMAGVHQFVKIGRNAMVGGMSKLVQDVVPYTIVDGHPAKVVGLNNVGISRAGVPLESRRLIKKAYKILYRSGLSLPEAIAVIEQEVDSCEEVEHFLRFLRNAERGICRERRDFEDK
ncbi:MAG: acyl-ACP--UDP-N-acetylglucosamine O-acyltransferase [Selenomonadaceae bacterium]|nr:acyl-ACP--UDP-N-acetylglucosamine O-acyltransferase [Selenomonadaceae bacterium]MBQ6758501.1 acyl-ACP--UDP-N-acetylglucosamine O-acyltransferase [Selenomonadaceae bacterium]MBR0102073.1 acyl-ACP--UDP-N-acetylglucosamine O-acyltransferase [Selenomonadaceae bacterium]